MSTVKEYSLDLKDKNGVLTSCSSFISCGLGAAKVKARKIARSTSWCYSWTIYNFDGVSTHVISGTVARHQFKG